MQHSIQLPNARHENLIIKQLDDETLVYDREDDQAHCLNSTAARVWQLCDGQSSVSEIATSLAKQIGTEADDTIVWLALDQLQKFNLLKAAPVAPAHLAGISRRQWVRSVGLAAIAVPVIISMVAPTAQAQGSCLPTGFGPCSPGAGGTNCCSGTGNCTSAPPKTCK